MAEQSTTNTPGTKPPVRQGPYDPAFEHDACGVAFVVDLKGRRSHEMVQLGVSALCNLEHRGASGAEPDTGDGAGILIQVPDEFFRAVAGFELPEAGAYATGIAFLPAAAEAADAEQLGRHHRHPRLPQRRAQADEDAGRRRRQHDFGEALPAAGKAERLRHFDKIAIDAADRAEGQGAGDCGIQLFPRPPAMGPIPCAAEADAAYRRGGDAARRRPAVPARFAR